MSKKILVLYYTQSGQLGDILRKFAEPLVDAGNTVEYVFVKPEKEYPFPWTSKSFFSVMPDSVLGNTTPLIPFQLEEKNYDLIIFGYQPWFLSPSIPANSILQHPDIARVLKNTPVITITGARNMWISALERIKKTLKEHGSNLVGNVALVDKNQNHVSVITICYWMFTGKRDRFLSVFPKPGVSESDISQCREYGKIVEKYLQKNNWADLQNELLAHKAVIIDYNLMFTELKGAHLFNLWAGLISKRKNKTVWLVVFKYYLIIALFIAAPIILLLNTLLFKPFLSARIKKQTDYYLGVN